MLSLHWRWCNDEDKMADIGRSWYLREHHEAPRPLWRRTRGVNGLRTAGALAAVLSLLLLLTAPGMLRAFHEGRWHEEKMIAGIFLVSALALCAVWRVRSWLAR